MISFGTLPDRMSLKVLIRSVFIIDSYKTTHCFKFFFIAPHRTGFCSAIPACGVQRDIVERGWDGEMRRDSSRRFDEGFFVSMFVRVKFFFYNEDIVLHPGDDCRDVPSAER